MRMSLTTTSKDTRPLARLVAAHERELIASWTKRHLQVEVIREGIASQAPGDPAEAYSNSYLKPLLGLLNGYLRTERRDYAAVYADERMRFIAFGASCKDRQAVLAELAEDERDLLALVSDDDRLERRLTAALRHLHRGLHATTSSSDLQLVLVGDCLMTELRTAVIAEARQAGLELATTHFYFSARQGVGLSPHDVTQHLERNRVDLLAFSFLTFEGIPPYQALLADASRLNEQQMHERVTAIIEIIAAYLHALRAVTSATFLVHDACGLPLSRWRRRLPFIPPLSAARKRVLTALGEQVRALVAELDNTILLDERATAARTGLRRAGQPLLPRALTANAMFHTSRFGTLLAPEYLAICVAYRTLAAAKVLLVDFDNTLWHGVMAEGEVEHDLAAQRLLKQLKEAGVLLVALSKNTPEAIRWDEMLLTREDFVLRKIGWGQKARSVQEVADELDLALTSFVLIDDSPAERELVRSQLPDVLTLDSTSPATWQALAWMLSFPNTKRTREAATRTTMYRQGVARQQARSAALNYEAAMASLELRASFHPAHERDLDRALELITRTSQFNTTTQRYSMSELRQMIAGDRHGVYVASLADSFGDLGVVGLVIVERAPPELIFDSVVMSCRAMGFGLELLLLRGALDLEPAWDRAVGRYVATARNGPCATLFSDAGFQPAGDSAWVLDSSASWPAPPSWLGASTPA